MWNGEYGAGSLSQFMTLYGAEQHRRSFLAHNPTHKKFTLYKLD